MTSEQLKRLLKVMDSDLVVAPDEATRIRSSEWRRENVHTRSEISLGSLLRRNADYGQTG